LVGWGRRAAEWQCSAELYDMKGGRHRAASLRLHYNGIELRCGAVKTGARPQAGLCRCGGRALCMAARTPACAAACAAHDGGCRPAAGGTEGRGGGGGAVASRSSEVRRAKNGGQEAPFWARAGIKCAVSGSGQRGGARLVW
jgi:hypothetical protein